MNTENYQDSINKFKKKRTEKIHEILSLIGYEESKPIPMKLCSKHNIEKANELIFAANIFAVSSFETYGKIFPEISNMVYSDLDGLWDAVVFAACIGTAFIAMPIDNNTPELAYAIENEMYNWDPYLLSIMYRFAIWTKSAEEKYGEFNFDMAVDLISKFVWMHFKIHPKANRDLKKLAQSIPPAGYIGLPIANTFSNWWRDNPLISKI